MVVQAFRRANIFFSFYAGAVTNTLVQVLVVLKVLPGSSGVHIFEEFVTFVFGAQVGIWR